MPPNPFRFGIPSIDRLLGSRVGASVGQIDEFGICTVDGPPADNATSVCIVGPEGSGKSILSLHLASRYLADNTDANGRPATKVLYVSTDLSIQKARQTWSAFALDLPEIRKNPFCKSYKFQNENRKNVQIALEEKKTGTEADSVAHYLSQIGAAEAAFIDLAQSTAGDDWGYLNRVLASVEIPPENSPYLVIVDAVEGFQTLVGKFDAFGESLSRRSRIAQILRLAARKCHVVFIVEEPRSGSSVPEQFITDVVIRLRSDGIRGYTRRTIEIEKVRGQTHARGQHPFTMRKGIGSTTGRGSTKLDECLENPDDPPVYLVANPRRHALHKTPAQSYVIAFPSLHLQSRDGMERREKEPLQPSEECAAFGVQYLDEMLVDRRDEKKPQDSEKNIGHASDFSRGLPLHTVTALIGDHETQKTRLGHSFLAETFKPLKDALVRRLRQSPNPSTLESWLAHQTAGVGASVLLTTQDIDAHILAKRFAEWLLEDLPADLNANVDSLKPILASIIVKRVVCRRLEIHDLPAPILLHIIVECINGAERRVNLPPDQEKRIRVVIEDFSTWKEIYPEVRQDPLFLPFLLFTLRRRKVTTLIIDTHPGRPEVHALDPFDSELRALVDHQLYTWRVPFYGESRIAIAAIPPLAQDLRTSVRELIWGPAELNPKRPQVDPHFELYTGLEEGAPRPVPLEIRIFQETKGFEKYLETEEYDMRTEFTPSLAPNTADRRVIHPITVQRVEMLGELGGRRETRLDRTLISQVDEYWFLHDNRSIRNQKSYLDAVTWFEGKGDPSVDPLFTFRPGKEDSSNSGPKRRLDFFNPVDYSLRADTPRVPVPHSKRSLPDEADRYIDRVPFTWDFGFLLCDMNAWEKHLDVPIKRFELDNSRKKLPSQTVRSVWDSLRKAHGCAEDLVRPNHESPSARPKTRPNWRSFLGACHAIAEAGGVGHQKLPFDLELVTAESLSCLLLEVWASEVYDSLQSAPARQERFRQDVSTKVWPRGKSTLEFPLRNYRTQLFKTWLLLGDVLDLAGCVDLKQPFEPISRSSSANAVAVRHWYKSACSSPVDPTRPLLAVGLPGHFSVRGDWFLAVATASRSMRLADRALDILSSRRANFERMQHGIGLPTRNIMTPLTEQYIRTGLLCPTPTETIVGGKQSYNTDSRPLRNVSYAGLQNLGCDNKDFFWFWRSCFSDYDHLNRIWQKWIIRMVIAWHELKHSYEGRWISGFQIYDYMSPNLELSEPIPQAWDSKHGRQQFIEMSQQFDHMCDFLINLCQEASPPPEPSTKAKARSASA